jgi:hypothetical protein
MNAIRYYDKYGVEIFTEPCSSVFFVTPQNLVQVIWDSANHYPYVYISCYRIKLYGYTFSRTMLNLAKNIEQLTKIIELSMSTDYKLDDLVNAEEHIIDKFFEEIGMRNSLHRSYAISNAL